MSEILDFSAALLAAEDWIDDLTRRIGWWDSERVYSVFVAALHAFFRDSLPRNEAVYVGAQLPPLLRGFYYEGWHATGLAAARGREAYLERIRDSLHRDPGIDAEEVARAVFSLLAARMPAAELEDAKASTPKALHYLWPA